MAKKPIEYVEIEIDGNPVKLPKDEVVLWNARKLGYDIPHFCAHPWLEPLGACRMCLVRVETNRGPMPKLQTACSITPMLGMKIFTKHPDVIKARKEQLEFHLLNHPLECPVCDKGGECMLQDQTMDHGVQESRFIEQKRVRPDAMINHYIRHNYKRCIHCKRCTGFSADIDGSYLLRMVDRGAESIIVGFPDPEEAPRFCGNVIDICPVGALTAQSYRFKMGRVWEQGKAPSIGSLDSVGTNIWLAGRLGDVARIIPRNNAEVEDGLIDDVTRFSWECIEDPRRVKRAIVRSVDGETTVSRVSGEGLAAEQLMAVIGEHGPDSVGMIAGGKLNNEEYLALKLFAGSVLNTEYYHLGDELFGADEPDDAALAACMKHSESIEQIIFADTVLSLGCDLFDEAPSLGLRLDVAARRGKVKLLSARSYGSDVDRHADEFAGYSYGGLLRIVRGLANALDGGGEIPKEAQAIAAKLKGIGEDCAIVFGDEVWRDANPLELIHAIASLRDALVRANPDTKVYLNPVYPSVNSAGALLVNYLHFFTPQKDNGLRLPVGSIAKVLQAAADGKVKALLIFDADLLSKYPDRKLVDKAIKSVNSVVYCGPFANPTSEKAGLHLPMGTYAHRDGTVLSMEWRMQRRSRASIDSIAPSVMNVLDSIAAAMGLDALNIGEAGLFKKLVGLVPALRTDVPDQGALMKPERIPDAAAKGNTQLPPVLEGSVEQPVLVPKRFLYNNCEEIRYSPVFKGLVLPFFAYINPDDGKAQGIASGDEVVISSGDAGLKLKAKLARWVLPGSVVVNNYYIAQPANAMAGRTPVRVSMKKAAMVREG